MPNFEPDYIFDTFLVTPNNELAFTAANAIVHEIGTRYNPFFLYGAFSSGKTHLLHAIGNAVQEQQPATRILFVKGKDFAADIAFALRKRKLTNFYHKYQDCDFLMIKGFDALVDNDIAQNVAIRLFDALYRQKKQIIATTGLPTHLFPVMEAYLRDSYDTGLIADVLAPEELVKNRYLMLRD